MHGGRAPELERLSWKDEGSRLWFMGTLLLPAHLACVQGEIDAFLVTRRFDFSPMFDPTLVYSGAEIRSAMQRGLTQH